MRTAALTVLLLLLVPAGAHARGRCAEPGSGTDLRSANVRVYHVDREHSISVYFSCDRRTGRRMRIASDVVREVFIRMVRGRYLLYESADTPGGSITGSALVRFDMLSGERRVVAGFGSGISSSTVLEDLALTRRGAVVWIETRSQWDTVRRVELSDGRSQAELDPGPGVDRGSLALNRSGKRVYWTNDGEPRTAALW